MNFRGIYNRILSKPAIVSTISILALWFGATAGSLTPPGSPASTMYTLAQIFNPLASGSYDSTGISADQNGSLFENIKYIESQLGWASASNNLYYLGSGNVGIGDSSPETKFEVVGAASVSSMYIGGDLFSGWPLLAPNTGGAGAPDYSFSGCSTCGMFNDGSGVSGNGGFGFSVDGAASILGSFRTFTLTNVGRTADGIDNDNDGPIDEADEALPPRLIFTSNSGSTELIQQTDLSLRLSGGFSPFTTNIYSLGTSALRWSNLFASNTSISNAFEANVASVSQLYIAGSPFSGGAGVASDGLDFDEFVDSMTLDANLTVASSAFTTEWRGNFYHTQGNVGFGTVAAIDRVNVAGNLRFTGGAAREILVSPNILGAGYDLSISAGDSTPTSAGDLYLTGGQGLGVFDGDVILAHDGTNAYGNVGISSVSPGFKLAVEGSFLASSSFGSGLSDCDTPATSKLLWNESTGLFSCGTDQTGGGGGASNLQVRDYPGSYVGYPATASFNGNHFTLTASGSSDVTISLDWGAGGPASLSQSETVSGFWTFANNVSVSGNFELAGTVSSHLIPTVHDAYDLGSSALRWRDLYLASDSLHIGESGGEATITYIDASSNGLLIKPDGALNGLFVGDDWSNGVVGIGTTNPFNYLDIRIDDNADWGVTVNNDNSGTSAEATLTMEADSGRFRLRQTSTGFTTSGIFTSEQTILFNESTNGLALVSDTGPILFGNASAERARLTSLGAFGIGTANVSERLEVSGMASISDVLYAHGGCIGCGGGVGSDSLDFDEFESSLILDENTTLLFNGLDFIWQMGFGSFKATSIELDPLFELNTGNIFAGAEYTIDGVLQVGNVATASYSRFGTATTTHALSGQDSVLISQNLEVNGVLYADGGCVGCGGGSVTSNSLDFDEFVNAMTLDANTTISNGGFVLTVQGASLSGNLGPSATNTYDLGSQALRWRSIYVSSGSIHMGMQGNESIIDYDTTAESQDFLAFKPDGSTTTFRMYDNGNASTSGNFEVGGTLIANSISISSISGNLEITGYASASQYFGGGLTDCDVAGTSKLLWDATTGKFSCGTDSGSSTAGWTDDGTVVRLTTSTDNVGIGTSTVNQKLEVAGVASVSGNIIINNTTGNVGIGTSAPAARFDVMGGSGSAADLVNLASSTGTLVFQVNNDGLAKLTRTLVLGGGNISTTDLFQQINDDTGNNNPDRTEIGASSDLYIADDLELEGILDIGGAASVGGNFEVAGGYLKANSTAGTTLTPNYTFSNDEDTGIGNAYNNAPNRLFFLTNGSARGFFDSSGNLVLNSAAVYNTAGGAAMLDVTGTAGANDVVRFASVSGAEAMVIGPNRVVVIGGGAYRAADADFNQITTDTANTEPERSELTATDDLYIAGDLEIEGILDIGGAASFSSNLEMSTTGTRLILPDYVTAANLDTPVLAFNNDRDTGLAHEGTNAANKLYFVNAGNASGLFDGSGNFVLDNTAVFGTVGTAKLDVTGTAGANNIALFASSSAARALIIGPNRAVTIGGGNYLAADDFTQINDDTTNNNPDRAEIDQLTDLYISDDLELEGMIDIGTYASITSGLEVGDSDGIGAQYIKLAQSNTAPVAQYTWSNDSDTGLSNDFQNPNELFVLTGGTMRAMWDDDGDFQIGGSYDINLEPTATLTAIGQSGAHNIAQFSSSSSTLHSFIIGPNRALIIGGGAYAAADDFHQIVTNSATENPERSEISGLNDLYIGGNLEVDGILDISAEASVGGSFEISSGYLKIPDGTAALPSLRFQGSPTTGLFEAAADIFGFSTAGVERMRINASGNVAVGTTTTTNFFTIMGDVATLFEVASGSNEWLTVLEAGNVGIGDNTPTTTLDVAGNASVSGNLEVGGFVKTGDGSAAAPAKTFSSDPDTGFFSGGANILAFSTAGTERARLTNTGMGLGTSAISVRLEIAGTASAAYLFAQNSFQVANTATVSYSRLGSGTTGHSLDAGNDLLISDDLEVDGEIFADGGMTMGNNLNLNSNDITNVDNISANSFTGGTFSGTSFSGGSFSGSGLSVSGGVSGSGASFSGNIEVGGVAKLSNGSAGAPSYTFTGAMTTGMYNAGGTLAFSVGGAQRATITSGGLVNAITGFSVNGTAGQSSDCASNEFLGNMTVTAGIVTAGSCETDDVDYAERFYAGEAGIEPGDIVVANPDGPIDIGIEDAQFNQAVVKSTDVYQNSIVGVISTMPGLVIGAKGTPEHPAVEVALAGRVPVRVLTTNGHIQVGDRITSSDVPGAGMKAVSAGMVVGMALESTNLVASGSEQTIMVFLQPGYWAPSVAEATGGVHLDLEGPDSGLFSFIIGQFASLLNIEFGDSSVKADRVRAKSIELEGDNGDIHCVRIVGGELQSTAGACDDQATVTSGATPEGDSPGASSDESAPEPAAEESPDTESGDEPPASETTPESDSAPSEEAINGSPDEPFTEPAPQETEPGL